MNNNPTAFYFWLRGYFELSGATTLDATQVQIIKEHMDLVSTKVTPTAAEPPVYENRFGNSPYGSDNTACHDGHVLSLRTCLTC